MFVPDLLHVADYSGVTCHVIANVLYEMVHDLEFQHRSQAATLEFLNAELSRYYSENRVGDRTSFGLFLNATAPPSRMSEAML
jgi:hypothetical protein